MNLVKLNEKIHDQLQKLLDGNDPWTFLQIVDQEGSQWLLHQVCDLNANVITAITEHIEDPCVECHRYFGQDEEMYIVDDKHYCTECFKKRFPTDAAWLKHIVQSEDDLSDEEINTMNANEINERADEIVDEEDGENYFTTAANDNLYSIDKYAHARDILLSDDDHSETGGISFAGETLADFLHEDYMLFSNYLFGNYDKINQALRDCGIKEVPLAELSTPDIDPEIQAMRN